MKRLSPRLAALAGVVAGRPNTLILLDYDGTLVPIRSRPGLARLNRKQLATMARLHRGGVRLAILSGRSVANLRTRVDLPDIGYSGVFGLEARLPGWTWLHPRVKAMRPAIAGLIETLRLHFNGVPGVEIEDKFAGLTVHYRRVDPSRMGEFSRLLDKAKEQAPRGLRWFLGKAAWEVVPEARWSKGKAALLLWRRLGKPFLVAVGDDAVDEPMLREARTRGAGIKVGPGDTGADYRAGDPDEVHRFLRAVAESSRLRRYPRARAR